MESTIKTITSFRMRLIPTDEQEEYLKQACGTARWAYNFALGIKDRMYKEQGLNVSGLDIRKALTKLKQSDEKYKWLKDLSNNITKQAIKDCDRAFNNFFKGVAKYPKFKNKKHVKQSFYVEHAKFNRKGYVWIEKLHDIKLSKHWETKYLDKLNNYTISNPRISFDGCFWYISFGVEVIYKRQKLTEEVIGIDLGIKNTAICSNNIIYKNINKTKRVKKIEKKKRRLQRKLSKKYEMNKEANKFIKTHNIIKLEHQVTKLIRKLKNIREDNAHQISREIVNRRPKAIVMETLNIKGMMKNKHLAEKIQEQNWYKLLTCIKYKAENQGTIFIQVPRKYKSTQICSKCGREHKVILSERTYVCNCGNNIDRDINSALNLMNYGIKMVCKALY